MQKHLRWLLPVLVFFAVAYLQLNKPKLPPPAPPTNQLIEAMKADCTDASECRLSVVNPCAYDICECPSVPVAMNAVPKCASPAQLITPPPPGKVCESCLKQTVACEAGRCVIAHP
jgi:hypothetical protein